MWGQELFSCGNFAIARIIPTRVGTSRAVRSNSNRQVDHPHACGDKYIKNMTEINPLGSSPRVWGQGQSETTAALYDRIIPTRVGTSIRLLLLLLSVKDHPHACGDKLLTRTTLSSVQVSSPRVWGQVAVVGLGLYAVRIIPSRVGTRD